ncbi:hypothetical protein MVEG_06093 [Podila verticillata NRRL 6337]|nr:hypothetical protein MVEG_06093 [Podila verticillata NRRL 6337]
MVNVHSAQRRPKVMIVGAGIGGLFLALLLETAGIPYDIYERQEEVNPLNSAMAFGCNVLGLFRQLGIEQEFLEHAKPTMNLEVFNHDMKSLLKLDFSKQKEAGGYNFYIIARPVLYRILWRRIPPERLHLGKRMLSMVQGENGVQIYTSDKRVHQGDLLVGADGASSSVRQNMFKELEKLNRLPPEDNVPLPFKFISLIGQTEPLDTNVYKDLLREDSPFQCVVGKGRYSWTTFITKQNTICWLVVLSLDKKTKKDHDNFRTSEWGVREIFNILQQVEKFPIPNGGGDKTLRNLFDKTRLPHTTKVILEEKVFKTWYHRRTVLLGDACHKMNPAGGMGAIQAMHDAVVLANWINTLRTSPTVAEAEKIFKEYQEERKPYVQQAFDQSKLNSQWTSATLQGMFSRWIFNLLPKRVIDKVAVSNVGNRPVASFLPPPVDQGSIPPDPQPSCTKTLAILAQQVREDQMNIATASSSSANSSSSTQSTSTSSLKKYSLQERKPN